MHASIQRLVCGEYGITTVDHSRIAGLQLQGFYNQLHGYVVSAISGIEIGVWCAAILVNQRPVQVPKYGGKDEAYSVWDGDVGVVAVSGRG